MFRVWHKLEFLSICYHIGMLRDNHESFAPEFSKILSRLGIKDAGLLHGFQLLKFERIDPDAFVWMVRAENTYVVTIVDGGTPAPNANWLADWSGGLRADDLEHLTPAGVDSTGFRGLEDGFDYVQVYLVPKDYDHCEVVTHPAS